MCVIRLSLLVCLLGLVACRSLPPAVEQAYPRAADGLQITSVGHATFLIELAGQLILTDPWFYETPITGRHPEPLGVSPERLPPLDIILVTHGHVDHFDRTALRRLPVKSIPVVCAPGMREAVTRLGFSHVVELPQWETFHAGAVAVTAVPARHYGPANGFVIEGAGSVVYFAGETTLSSDVERIGARFRRIDVAFLPADGLTLRWGWKLAMGPEEAAEAVRHLRPSVVIPILDHDFSRSLGGLVLRTTGSVDAFKMLVERRAPGVEFVLVRPGSTWRAPPWRPDRARLSG